MIGERLKMLRKKKMISQREVGKALNLSDATISFYENDKSEPVDSIKIKLAKYYNISLDYLLGLIDEEICYYNENEFLKYPDKMSNEEFHRINEFIAFIYFQREQSNKP